MSCRLQRRVAPGGGERGNEVRLAFQHHPVIEHFQIIGRQRCARRGDVDNRLGGTCRRRAFRRPQAFHDAVIGNPVLGEEKPRQVEIFRGDITTEETQKRGTDRVTRVTASPRYTDLNHILMSELIPDGGTVEDGIEKIRKQTSIAKGVYKGEQLSQIITYGYPLVGTPRQMLDQVCNAYKLDWKIEGDALYINAVDTVDTEIKNLAPVISAKTGLLDAPYQFKGSEGQSKDDPAKRKGLRFKALINPTVVPGSLVKVVHKNIDAFYRVDEVTYKGDYRGNSWEMECVCYTRIKEGT